MPREGPREALGRGPQLQLVRCEQAEDNRRRAREAAALITAIERGLPIEDAFALIGLDRAAGAKRILRALLEAH